MAALCLRTGYPQPFEMNTDAVSQIEADFIAYNKTGDAAHVQKYPAAEVERFIKRAYEVDNTPSLMVARSGAIHYLRTLRPQQPSFGRLARLLRVLFLLALAAGLLLAAVILLGRR